MKFLDEYRDVTLAKKLLDEIHRLVKRPWVIMEICGGQTHAIMRYGLDQLLPSSIELVHGPGCPVCVTSIELIEKALVIASQPGVIFTSYGDMLRVPGSHQDLFSIRASGGDVRVVYSPLDAVDIAVKNPGNEVVFFAIGFETTAPANAMAILRARDMGLKNFSVLVSQVRVPPAMRLILSSPQNRVQGFLAAGHVCTVMGYWEYLPIAEHYQVPIVVTGFEPVDILQGILKSIQLLETNTIRVENAYTRLVSIGGNKNAQDTINKVFKECDQKWRGIGLISGSGWTLQPDYAELDAVLKFGVKEIQPVESELCVSGKILQGFLKPFECKQFGSTCTPEHPLGATMVSSEGACAAYYRYWGKT
jgi:hydrogenase expression/formation protein HypD